MVIDKSSLNSKLKIANAWRLKGKTKIAISIFQEVLELEPNNFLANQYYADLLIREKEELKAEAYYQKALEIDFEQTNLDKYYHYRGLPHIRKEASINGNILPNPIDNKIPNNPQGKIDLSNQAKFQCHRSGWDFAIDSLKPLHNCRGIIFDGFLEKTFIWLCQRNQVRNELILAKMKQDEVFFELATSQEKGIVPYRKPWVGFLHNPQNMPSWLHSNDSPQKLLNKQIWQESLPYCVGLFTLSEYHARWLREKTKKPVSSLIAPTEIPDKQFDFAKFVANPDKQIIQVGWWLRKLSSIYQLPIAKNNTLNYQKKLLIPNFSLASEIIIDELIEQELVRENTIEEVKYWENTTKVYHLNNDRYDEILTENIVFIELYDTSVNNAVIECIARSTPILVNPLPAVVEYLGEDYPFYFRSLSEAAEKAMNTGLIEEAHHYLKNCPTRAKLSPEYFLSSFQNSEVYQSIDISKQ